MVRVERDQGADTHFFLSGYLSCCLYQSFTGLEERWAVGSDPFLSRDSGPVGSSRQVCVGFQNRSPLYSHLRLEPSLSNSTASLSPQSALSPWDLACLAGSGM